MAGVNLAPFIEFARFVEDTRKQHIGCDIAENPKPYVPYSALEEYWTQSKISAVLHAFRDRLDIDIGVIRQYYLRIFSTLVFTDPDAVLSLADLFISRNLIDERLPWSSQPSEWPDAPFFNNYFKKIAEDQWQFFPLEFKRITIAHGTAAIVKAFDIHPEYNGLTPKNEQDPAQHTFVFKTYHNKKHASSYDNERRALQRLTYNPSPNLVKFYGCFRQHGTYSLILEYADGGNLGEFFTGCRPPTTIEDVLLFWRSLFQVFSGLDRIHQLMLYSEDLKEEFIVKGIHEDIRPDNILLVKGPSGSPYDFTPKIADFGLYGRVRTVRGGSAGSGMGLDHYGNQRFSSPECCHHTIQRHKGTNMITTSADIFSIGAVLSHTVAWVVGGREEQDAYLEARKAYHEANLRRFKHSGYEGCFHDSIEPLPVVVQQHGSYLERVQPLDDVTPKVLEWIKECMLLRVPKDRLRARDILEKFEQFMDSRSLASPYTPPTAVTDATLQSSSWSVPVVVSPPPTLEAVVLPTAALSGADSGPVCRPALQVVVSSDGDDAAAPATGATPHLQRKDSKSIIQPSLDASRLSSSSHAPQADLSQGNSSATPSPVSSNLPGFHIGVSQFHKFFKSGTRQNQPADPETAQLVDYLEHNLGGRDQFFFIDDSASMRGDRKTIADGFCALACIAKRLDPNQIELAFASRPGKIHRARRTKGLRHLVERCAYKGDGHLMETRLGELIDAKIIPRLPYKVLGVNINLWARKKVSIYVFTDGDWGDATNSGDACGVERPVKKLIEELKKRRLDRTQVSLHFVRFGDKENGRKHLERLDEFGRKDGWDIVDVKHIKTGVAGMIIGPLTRANDDIPAS